MRAPSLHFISQFVVAFTIPPAVRRAESLSTGDAVHRVSTLLFFVVNNKIFVNDFLQLVFGKEADTALGFLFWCEVE